MSTSAVRDLLKPVGRNSQGRKDEEHAGNEEYAEPERQGQDHQQLHDLRQRDAPRRIKAIAERSTASVAPKL